MTTARLKGKCHSSFIWCSHITINQVVALALSPADQSFSCTTALLSSGDPAAAASPVLLPFPGPGHPWTNSSKSFTMFNIFLWFVVTSAVLQWHWQDLALDHHWDGMKREWTRCFFLSPWFTQCATWCSTRMWSAGEAQTQPYQRVLSNVSTASLLKPNQPFCSQVPVLIPSTKMHLIAPSLDFSHLQGLITAQPNDWEPWKANVIKETFKPARNTWNSKEILHVCRANSRAPLACSSLSWKWTHTGLSWRPCILL